MGSLEEEDTFGIRRRNNEKLKPADSCLAIDPDPRRYYKDAGNTCQATGRYVGKMKQGSRLDALHR